MIFQSAKKLEIGQILFRGDNIDFTGVYDSEGIFQTSISLKVIREVTREEFLKYAEQVGKLTEFIKLYAARPDYFYEMEVLD